MAGVGPGVGVAETGPTVSCAWLIEKPAIAIAATQTLRMNNLVSIMALLPALALSSSGRREADAAGEWFGDHQFAVRDFQRQRRQRPWRRAGHQGAVGARIVLRVVTRAFEQLWPGQPIGHVAAGMRADRRVGDHSICRVVPGRALK